MKSGAEIPIEERSPQELHLTYGLLVNNGNKTLTSVQVPPLEMKVWNPAFDVTPAELITGIATEKGIVLPEKDETFDIAKALKTM